MAGTSHSPSLSKVSKTSDNNSSEQNKLSVNMNFDGSRGSLMRGATKVEEGYLSSFSDHKNKTKVPSHIGDYNVLTANSNNNILHQEEMNAPKTSKRSRGRPLGSKNKPKTIPIGIKQEVNPPMQHFTIAIPSGCDVVKSLMNFARRRSSCITVIGGSGSVSDVILCHPVSHVPTSRILGPINMLSLTATCIGVRFPSLPSSPAHVPGPECSSIGILLSGSQGQIVGGIVGKVMASSVVLVNAILLKNPVFCTFPSFIAHDDDDDDDDDNYDNGDRGGDDGDEDNSPFSSVINVDADNSNDITINNNANIKITI